MPNPVLDSRWSTLVRRLHDDIDELVATFLERIADIPPYGDSDPAFAQRVREDARMSFEYLLLTLGDTPRVSAAAGIAQAVGRARARRRVPLESVLAAVRLDFGVLWARLRGYASPQDDDVLVAHVEHVLRVVEGYTAEVQRGYLLEQAVMARELEYAVAALLTELLDGPASTTLVERVARALDVDPHTRFLVCATPLACKDELWRAHRRAAAQGRGTWWTEREDQALCLFTWRSHEAAGADRLLGSAPCAMGPIADGVAGLPAAARVAGRLATVVRRDDGPLTVRDLWLRTVVNDLDVVTEALSDDVLGAMAHTPAPERERLLQAVAAYLRCGTIQGSAEQLFCHRNTVLNRLHRVEALTGLDVTQPADATLLQAALAVPFGDPKPTSRDDATERPW